jgi:hypothetical protein
MASIILNGSAMFVWNEMYPKGQGDEALSSVCRILIIFSFILSHLL